MHQAHTPQVPMRPIAADPQNGAATFIGAVHIGLGASSLGRDAAGMNAFTVSTLADAPRAFGHPRFGAQRLHFAAAAACVAIAPLGIVAGEAAFVVLLAVSLMRSKELWPVWAEALRSPVTIAIGSLAAWMVISLAWSPDPLNGADRMLCVRVLAWAVLLYPLLRDTDSRLTLLLALLVGIAVLSLTQMSQWATFYAAGGRTEKVLHRFGGLHGEVGKAGLWSCAGVCIGVFLCTSERLSRGSRALASAAMFCCIGGACACATLRAIGGAAVGLAVCALIGIALPLPDQRRSARAWVLVPLTVALLGLGLGAERRIPWTVMFLPAGTPSPVWTESYQHDEDIDGAIIDALAADGMVIHDKQGIPVLQRLASMKSVAPRLLWWRACWNAYAEHPVAGCGWGATPTIVSNFPGSAAFAAANPQIAALHPKLLAPSQPHSLYLMTLGELGTVGIALLIGLGAIILRKSIRSVRACLELGGPAAASILWFVAAGGDTVFNAAVLGAGAILMVCLRDPPTITARADAI